MGERFTSFVETLISQSAFRRTLQTSSYPHCAASCKDAQPYTGKISTYDNTEVGYEGNLEGQGWAN